MSVQYIGYLLSYKDKVQVDNRPARQLKYRVQYFFFSSTLISLIADGPHHYHPACGHEGSSHLSPVHALQFFIAMQVPHSYNSSTNG